MRKFEFKIRLFSIATILFLLGCSPCTDEEISRIKSTDLKVEAVHIRRNCGATTSFQENIFLIPSGEADPEPKDNNQIFSADHVDELKMVWREPRGLEIHYNEARIFHFSNFWHSKNLDNFRYVVEARLVPSKDDFSLSKRDRWIE